MTGIQRNNDKTGRRQCDVAFDVLCGIGGENCHTIAWLSAELADNRCQAATTRPQLSISNLLVFENNGDTVRRNPDSVL
jgi:hypothetical protein